MLIFGNLSDVWNRKRLGKQRVEAYQIWTVLVLGVKANYTNSPISRMWNGYTDALSVYLYICCKVWEERGYRNEKMAQYLSMYKINELVKPYLDGEKKLEYPSWFGKDEFHDSHKAMLYHKGKLNSELNHYQDFEPFSHITQYYWPVPLLTKMQINSSNPSKKRKRNDDEGNKRKVPKKSKSEKNKKRLVVKEKKIKKVKSPISLIK